MNQELVVEQSSIGDAIVLRPSGDIDMSRASSIRKAVGEAMRAQPARLIMDLSHVAYMDSSGLATLVEALQHAMRSKVKFILVGITPRVKSAFEITKLTGLFTIATTVEEATKA